MYEDVTVRNDFTRIINKEGYKIGAEIGMERGYNSAYLLENSNLDKLYCFEFYKTRASRNTRDITLEKMSKFGDRFELIEGCSWDEALKFDDNFFDYVYIDGDHVRVAKDLRAFWPLVRSGGMFSGHDYVKARKCRVIEAVDAFSEKHNVSFNFTEEELPSFWMIKE